MSDERRGSPRVAAHLAGELETAEGKSTIAISRDIAAGGLLVFTRSRPAVGSSVKLTVVFNDEQLKLTGTVLRCDDLEPGASTLWRTQVAIRCDDSDPTLAKLYAAIANNDNAN